MIYAVMDRGSDSVFWAIWEAEGLLLDSTSWAVQVFLLRDPTLRSEKRRQLFRSCPLLDSVLAVIGPYPTYAKFWEALFGTQDRGSKAISV